MLVQFICGRFYGVRGKDELSGLMHNMWFHGIYGEEMPQFFGLDFFGLYFIEDKTNKLKIGREKARTKEERVVNSAENLKAFIVK